MNRSVVLILLLLLCAIVSTISLVIGFNQFSSETYSAIFFGLRLPRLLTGLSVGAGLALSGVCLQSIFKNPLCDPYTLGISSGAAIGAAVGYFLLPEKTLLGSFFSALFGAAIFSYGSFFFQKRGNWGTEKMLLFGSILGFFGSSVLIIWLYVVAPQGQQMVLSWLLGDLGRLPLTSSVWLGIAISIVAGYLVYRARILDYFLLGELEARALGLDVQKILPQIILSQAILVSLCVAAAGMIGFVGLLIPHLSRHFFGSLHNQLIPGALILGATVLVGSDAIAQHSFGTMELPVGVVTTFFGAPCFAWILWRRADQ